MSAMGEPGTLGPGSAYPSSRYYLRVTLSDDPAELAATWDGTTLCLRYGTNASGKQIQAAIDEALRSVGMVSLWRVEGACRLGEPEKPRRRPGPPPRAETRQERTRRWRREGR